MLNLLRNVASNILSPVELRLFAEYGGIFITKATPPPKIIFADAAEVESFQQTLDRSRARIGEFDIELQSEAIDALLLAASDIAEKGGSITPRANDSGSRSYEDTVKLWTRNVTRGLEHWQGEGLITEERAGFIAGLAPIDQVAVILEMEEAERIYFGTFFDKSILYSVAAPGASQHLSLLAFDVAEYQEQSVERALSRRGWFRTVPNDLPHFTFLGCDQQQLSESGLKLITRDYGDRSYSFWIPDLDRLP